MQGDERVFESICSEYPGTHALSVPRFTVDHARHVAQFATEGTGEARMLVIYFAVFSPDAAQVLLKSLEEPAPDTTIVFVTPYPYVVPLTIRSRVMMLTPERHTETHRYTKAQAAAYIKDELASTNDDGAAMRRAKAVAFLDDLETMFKAAPEKARTIYEGKRMLFHANMPVSYIAEYVVATCFLIKN